ncbi:two-component response regulator ORR21 [Lathyrus oleraceus]|uniref:two-component response regulator ORR21 n=1 Tax=Pisum sativum TaxID=3888 RepID=UPI0021D35279|nr:two-component response regulator ORR21-like [Pisum sativum]
MDSYNFVQYVTLQHKIPVIVISSDATESSVLKSIIHGACDYWVQPLHEKQFKTMWGHVARKTLMENKEDEDLGFLNAQLHKEPEVLEILETESHKEHQDLGFLNAQLHKEPGLVEILETESHKEDEVLGFLKAQSYKEHEVVEIMEGPRHERKREREDDNPPKETEAKPRKILKMMDVSGLTTEHVASHLQKYRNYLKKPCCGKRSKKSRFDIPAESEHAQSMLQQHSTDVTTNYHQVSDIGYNNETEKLSTGFGDYQVSDIMNDFPDPSDLLFDLDDELISLLF